MLLTNSHCFPIFIGSGSSRHTVSIYTSLSRTPALRLGQDTPHFHPTSSPALDKSRPFHDPDSPLLDETPQSEAIVPTARALDIEHELEYIALWTCLPDQSVIDLRNIRWIQVQHSLSIFGDLHYQYISSPMNIVPFPGRQRSRSDSPQPFLFLVEKY